MDLDIVSWNVHGLPWPLDLHWLPFDRTPRHGERVANILAHLHTLRPRPDIVAFQEVWRDDDAARIKFALSGYHVVESRNAPIVRPTGLLTCIRQDRWEVVDAISTEYPTGADVDAKSHKGFHMVTLRDRTTSEPLMFINTHLQSQYAKHGPKTYPEVRIAQIRAMTAAAKKKPTGVPLLASGDFNTYPYPSDRDVYRHISDGAPWIDLTKQARAACGCETNFDSDLPTDKDGWIDYLLWYSDPTLRSEANIRLIVNRRIDDPYSDHQGLRAHVRITPPAVLPALSTIGLVLVTQRSTRRQWLMSVAAVAADLLPAFVVR